MALLLIFPRWNRGLALYRLAAPAEIEALTPEVVDAWMPAQVNAFTRRIERYYQQHSERRPGQSTTR